MINTRLRGLVTEPSRALADYLLLFQSETPFAGTRIVVRFDTISITGRRSIVVVRFAVVRSEGPSHQRAFQESVCERRIHQASFGFLG